jgi:hypothetical protein
MGDNLRHRVAIIEGWLDHEDVAPEPIAGPQDSLEEFGGLAAVHGAADYGEVSYWHIISRINSSNEIYLGIMRIAKFDSILTKEYLIREHIEKQRSPLDISKEIGCNNKTVSNYLDHYGLPRLAPAYRGRKMAEHCGWRGCGELSLTRFNGFRNGARVRNIAFHVTIEDLWDLYLKQERKCALSGVEIAFQSANRATASLDRKDPTLPYEIDNVWWVHYHVNYAKQSLGVDEFIELCVNVAQTSGPGPS